MQTRALMEPMEAIIAEVIELHPEYHRLLHTETTIEQLDYSPEQGQTNPFLHMGMHIALREQAAADRPAGMQIIYRKLIDEKGQHDAEHDMMECLGEALWNAQRINQAPDEAAYLECLQKL